jgi:hypothetical protein
MTTSTAITTATKPLVNLDLVNSLVVLLNEGETGLCAELITKAKAQLAQDSDYVKHYTDSLWADLNFKVDLMDLIDEAVIIIRTANIN